LISTPNAPAFSSPTLGSSTPYKQTTKTHQEIARDLNVRYLLTATVRWLRAAGGVRNLQVSAELVEVRRTRSCWGEDIWPSLFANDQVSMRRAAERSAKRSAAEPGLNQKGGHAVVAAHVMRGLARYYSVQYPP
jgi:hypothetical protein